MAKNTVKGAPDRAMRALLSVSDKTGVVDLARALAARGWALVSTGGTARLLSEAGFEVIAVSDLTGFAEMLDGRVKTLHPRIHAAILARRDRADDRAALAEHQIVPIDLVAVNLYPFARAATNPEVSLDGLIEEIDVGGPTLIRAAAKNFQDVLVVVDAAEYGQVVAEIDRPGGPSRAFRFALAQRAFAHTAAYDETIAAALVRVDPATWTRRPLLSGGLLPDRLRLDWIKLRDLRYGENPHQRAAWYATQERRGFGAAQVLQGKELSFTNLLDLDAAARIMLEFDEPAAVIIKHTNPCGVATGKDAAEAYLKARDADLLSAFGGIVGLNRPVDEEAARAIMATFIEAILAPGVEDAARPLLAAKGAMRIVVADFEEWRRAAVTEGDARADLRSILGGLLLQERDRVEETPGPGGTECRVVTRRAPSDLEWSALRFAWRVAAHVKSNAVVFAREDRTVAVGAGQMSRVDAVKVAMMKAAGRIHGQHTVAASDAFFPFRDGIDAIAEAGATAVVQPGGSVRDAEVIAAADEHGLAMVFTGRRHFRH